MILENWNGACSVHLSSLPAESEISDSHESRVWLQAATRALENLPEAVEPLQATLDASLPKWQYSVGFEAVRCMHAEVCRLLIRRRLPSLSGPQWVALVDECMQWERTVCCILLLDQRNFAVSLSNCLNRGGYSSPL